jgi:hypothetical protein
MYQEDIETNEEENEGLESHAGLLLHQGPPTLSPEESLRFELLNLSKEILLGKAAMRWETHKHYEDVSFEEIIEQAKRMFSFVRGEE